jgi:hypothetical protein
MGFFAKKTTCERRRDAIPNKPALRQITKLSCCVHRLFSQPQAQQAAPRIARRAGNAVDPEAVAEGAFGPLLSLDTKQMLARAETRPQALALLLMAPEFQRR